MMTLHSHPAIRRIPAHRLPRLGAVLLVAMTCLTARAQTHPHPMTPPANVVSLSASAQAEVPQDLLSITLSVQREAADPGTVQAQLKQALDAALTLARAEVQSGQFEVRTGQFSLYPRHGRDGRISAWQGAAELVLDGRDIARISALAGRLPGMGVSQVAFSLSREQRQRVEADVQAQAIERFRARADAVARSFGFGGYSLREVSVGSADAPMPMLRRAPMAMEARAAAADMPVPVEAGRALVQVTVSGSVQLR